MLTSLTALLSEPTFWAVAAAVVCGGLMRGFVGFGGAMVMVPSIAMGYDVVTAVNGQAALDILDGGYVPDLVLTDVVMPGAPNGAELAELILKEKPDQKILFMTGYAENAAALADIVAEGNAILNKPFTRNELAASIRRRIDRKKS